MPLRFKSQQTRSGHPQSQYCFSETGFFGRVRGESLTASVSHDSVVSAILKQNEERREAIATLERAAMNGDKRAFEQGLARAEATGATASAFRIIARGPRPPETFQRWFVGCWFRRGDILRSQVGDDVALVSGLRNLLPKYSGDGLTIYRGDSAYNRKRRAYGFSWSKSKSTAEGFARGVWQTFEGGSVLLTAHAAPNAIICDIGSILRRSGECEILIDRRKLTNVEVLQRYPQMPFTSFQA
jgi:hypothetical protein